VPMAPSCCHLPTRLPAAGVWKLAQFKGLIDQACLPLNDSQDHFHLRGWHATMSRLIREGRFLPVPGAADAAVHQTGQGGER